jgi:hypothetical protein
LLREFNHPKINKSKFNMKVPGIYTRLSGSTIGSAGEAISVRAFSAGFSFGFA